MSSSFYYFPNETLDRLAGLAGIPDNRYNFPYHCTLTVEMFENTSNHCYHPHTDFSADGLHWDGLDGDNKAEMTGQLFSFSDLRWPAFKRQKYQEMEPTFLQLIGLIARMTERIYFYYFVFV